MGQTVHGFRVTNRDGLDLLDCPTVTLEHIKSGATVYYIASSDPNRTFDITFQTPALDDKGIPHIFEHITISGSEKYPHQNLFFPLSYQTYNTYANAMTESTTTTFPVSSLSDGQLLKLMDYYLDGVFHPMVYDEQRLFQREAWRYNLESADAPITINGTVYNEMKGGHRYQPGRSLQRPAYPLPRQHHRQQLRRRPGGNSYSDIPGAAGLSRYVLPPLQRPHFPLRRSGS